MSKDWIKSLPNCFGLEVTGNNMDPLITKGDTLYVNRKKHPKGNTKDIAVLKIDGRYHICRFILHERQFLLLYDNAPATFVDANQIEIIGKVVGGSFGIKNTS